MYELGGGGLMDVGVYPIGLLRAVLGEEPTVTAAQARAIGNVDWDIRAQLLFPSGVRGSIRAAIHRLFSWTARLTATTGEVKVFSPYHPHGMHRFVVSSRGKRRRERITKTYDFQFEAFRDAITPGSPILTGADNAIATLEVVDAVYAAAGLPLRQPLH